MTIKQQLIKKIEQSPEDLMEELLDFLLFIKNLRYPQETQLRPYGLCKSEFVTPENFNELLSDDIIKDFES
jgi:hypothetical protein